MAHVIKGILCMTTRCQGVSHSACTASELQTRPTLRCLPPLHPMSCSYQLMHCQAPHRHLPGRHGSRERCSQVRRQRSPPAVARLGLAPPVCRPGLPWPPEQPQRHAPCRQQPSIQCQGNVGAAESCAGLPTPLMVIANHPTTGSFQSRHTDHHHSHPGCCPPTSNCRSLLGAA